MQVYKLNMIQKANLYLNIREPCCEFIDEGDELNIKEMAKDIVIILFQI